MPRMREQKHLPRQRASERRSIQLDPQMDRAGKPSDEVEETGSSRSHPQMRNRFADTTTRRRKLMLRLWWWMFSPWYRRLGTPKRAEKYIAHVASEHDVTRPQAIALICQ